MRDGRIIILHVFADGLIFSEAADNYDSLEGVDNLYYYYPPMKNGNLKNIKDKRVKIINNFQEYVRFFSDPVIDVILFYSLPYNHYYLFDYIDDRKFVIWWAWGYDIYYKQGKYPPLIKIREMYKPLTKDYMKTHSYTFCTNGLLGLFRKIINFPQKCINKIFTRNVLLPRPQKTQEEILARIDWFSAPLDVEYNLMRKLHCNFTAGRKPRILVGRNFPFIYKEKIGNILVNHSLTYTDNHLDIFQCLKDVKLVGNRKYVIPVSYGIDGFNGNPQNLIDASNLDPSKTLWLTKVLPLEEYEGILSSISHAIFGALRQQALGNIYKCLRSGVKVYLYEDSMIYKELKEMGYIIFSIEKDLTLESLSACLSFNDAKNNYSHFMERLKINTPARFQTALEKAIQEKK